MHTAGILSASSDESQLWKLTWDRIDTFLPNLRDEVFKPHQMGRGPLPAMRFMIWGGMSRLMNL